MPKDFGYPKWVNFGEKPEKFATGRKWNVFEMVFNPNRGYVKTFLQSVYADDEADARKQAQQAVGRGKKAIVEPA